MKEWSEMHGSAALVSGRWLMLAVSSQVIAIGLLVTSSIASPLAVSAAGVAATVSMAAIALSRRRIAARPAAVIAAPVTPEARPVVDIAPGAKKFESLLDLLHAAVYECRLDGSPISANPALVRMLGYESLDHFRRAFNFDVHVDREACAEVVQRLEDEGVVVDAERTIRRLDGTPLTVLLSGQALRDQTGAIGSYQMTFIDITERQRIAAEVRGSQRAEALGRLAGGVAHDFNNLLTVILACADEALESETAGAQDAVREIRSAAERAAALTRQLLAFSRQQQLQPRVVDLNEAVTGVEQLVRRLVSEDIALHTAYDSALKPIMIDPHQLEQVLVNRAANARDAMAGGGRLSIWTTAIALSRPETYANFSIPTGEYSQLVIQDAGAGIPAAIRDRIFEPVFSTQGNRGTGLGLATVYSIVKQSGGYITVDSEPDHGTTFRLYFPITSAGAEEAPVAAVAAAPVPRAETVLLVEDEQAVRSLVAAGLRRNGYTVVEASHPSEALELAESMERLDLMVTDVVMPDMNGPALAERLHQRRPETRVLFMSGYDDADMVRRGILTAEAPFIQKPFSWQALGTSVQALLSGPVTPASELAAA